jgi:hypothetical protein
MSREVNDLIKTKNHILLCSIGHPNEENQKALNRIEEKLKKISIQNWIDKNFEKLNDFIELDKRGGSINQIIAENKKLKSEIKLFKATMKGRKHAYTYATTFKRLYDSVN